MMRIKEITDIIESLKTLSLITSEDYVHTEKSIGNKIFICIEFLGEDCERKSEASYNIFLNEIDAVKCKLVREKPNADEYCYHVKLWLDYDE